MHLAVATRRDDRTEIEGWKLKAAQAAVGMSSKKLSRLLEVDDTTVYRWRTGGAPITLLVWRACLSAMELPPDWQPDERAGEQDEEPQPEPEADDASTKPDS